LRYSKANRISWSIKVTPDDVIAELLRVLRTGF
jgi:hypothetical protein